MTLLHTQFVLIFVTTISRAKQGRTALVHLLTLPKLHRVYGEQNAPSVAISPLVLSPFGRRLCIRQKQSTQTSRDKLKQ